ncbi:MAG: PIN domain-containing protein [Patescibacteria group bacterium]
MEKTSLLDTNVLVRFLVGDNEQQKAKAIEWFREATIGKRTIIVKPMVVAETVFVLESFYKHTREDIMSSLLPFIAMPALTVEEQDTLLYLWTDFLNGLHFVDAYLLTSARLAGTDLLTFDRDLLKRTGF